MISKQVKDNLEIPGEESEFKHVPFVLKYKIEVDSKVLTNSIIRITMTTRALMKNAKRRKHTCTDATYRIIYKGKQ